MIGTDAALDRIDQTLDLVTADGLSVDAMRWSPADPATIRALFIPVDVAEPMRLVALERDPTGTVLSSLRRTIDCHLIEIVQPAEAVDIVIDEEGGPACRDDAVLNVRATALAHLLKFAQVTGEYPAPVGAARADLYAEARAWERQIRLFGNAVVVGSDDSTGETESVPIRLLDFVDESDL